MGRENMEMEEKIGDVSVQKVLEQELHEVPPDFLLPNSNEAEFRSVAERLSARDLEDNRKQIVLSIHSWLVRVDGKTVLIDTGAGNDKNRPRNPGFHRSNHPYLERLAEAGVKPEEVDYVVNTHLHVDHSGWNTVLRDGKWVPTFPNARYLFPRKEADYWSSILTFGDDLAHSEFVYQDSIKPVIDAGLADFIEPDGGKFLGVFEFIESPGHSIGHMSLKIKSAGEEGFMAGDLMHHPSQVFRPDWNSVFCEFPDEAIASRRKWLDYCAEAGAKYFSIHFPGPGCGFVSRDGDGYSWTYA